jgi:hypothetical protein
MWEDSRSASSLLLSLLTFLTSTNQYGQEHEREYPVGIHVEHYKLTQERSFLDPPIKEQHRQTFFRSATISRMDVHRVCLASEKELATTRNRAHRQNLQWRIPEAMRVLPVGRLLGCSPNPRPGGQVEGRGLDQAIDFIVGW